MNRVYVLCLALALTAGCAGQRDTPAERFTETQTLPAKVIDVRTPAEYESGHVRSALNLPVDELETRILSVVPEKDTPLMVHCASGRRSARAKATLEKLGYTNVRDLGSLANARAVVEGPAAPQ